MKKYLLSFPVLVLMGLMTAQGQASNNSTINYPTAPPVADKG